MLTTYNSANAIRDMRLKLQLTQREVSHALGLSVAGFALYEVGERRLSGHKFAELLDLFRRRARQLIKCAESALSDPLLQTREER